MTPRERRTFLVASLVLLVASGARYAYERRVAPPVLPSDSVGVGRELLDETRLARAEAERRSRPLDAGERIDPNRAPAAELDRLPGVGPAVADRIVETRETEGGFRAPGELERVRGIGPATVERLTPHLDFSVPPPATFRRRASSGPGVGPEPGSASPGGGSLRRPTLGELGRSRAQEGPVGSRDVVDVNRAGARDLQTLSGVGPVLAERILALRKEKGGFGSVDELLEVRGVGPATLESLRPHLRAGP